mmetsp:Transcript_59987/g.111274  ORF Transcript_59987/g.111274 Transcript_59987/m.111274 type:complete len:201 (+) Transcript_59987:106-708(+)
MVRLLSSLLVLFRLLRFGRQPYAPQACLSSSKDVLEQHVAHHRHLGTYHLQPFDRRRKYGWIWFGYTHIRRDHNGLFAEYGHIQARCFQHCSLLVGIRSVRDYAKLQARYGVQNRQCICCPSHRLCYLHLHICNGPRCSCSCSNRSLRAKELCGDLQYQGIHGWCRASGPLKLLVHGGGFIPNLHKLLIRDQRSGAYLFA